MKIYLCLLVLTVVKSYWGLAAAQCNILSRQDLSGNPSSSANNGLVARALLATSNISSTILEVLNHNLVCLSTSGTRDKFNYVSVVAEYRIDNQTGSTLSQFEFQCNGSVWGLLVDGSSDDTVATPPDSSLSTSLYMNCSRCLNYRRPGSTSNNSQHCQECVNCEGLNLCTSSSCCNVYDLDGRCAEQCPSNAAASSEFICACREGFTGSNCTTDIDDCEPNPCQNGGRCTDRGATDFVCSCADGFGGATCQNLVCDGPCQNGGMCALVSGNVTCSCAEGFEGSTCQIVVSTSGCGTTCFIIIIVVVVGLILFVTVAVVVVTTVTAVQKDKKIKKYNVHKKQKRRKKSPQGKGKKKKSKKSVLVVPRTLDQLESSRNVQQLHNPQPAGLRVALEPLGDNDMDEEGFRNEVMVMERTHNERIRDDSVGIEVLDTPFEDDVIPAENISMDLTHV